MDCARWLPALHTLTGSRGKCRTMSSLGHSPRTLPKRTHLWPPGCFLLRAHTHTQSVKATGQRAGLPACERGFQAPVRALARASG